MAFTNTGKNLAMRGIAGATRYIALHLADDTELVGHGYARKAITAAEMAVSASGVITGPQNFGIYTANDDTAQQARKVSLYDAANGGNQILEPEALTGDVPAAPVNGQEFRLSLTIDP